MKLSIALSSSLALLLFASCKKEIKTEAPVKSYTVEKASWFIGEWGNKSEEGELTERWKKVNDSVYFGESYFVVGGKDTVFGEHVNLEDKNGKLSFIVTVPGQNDELPVTFEMTSSTDNQIVFENPKHDYPSKIVYNKVGNDSLVAEIFGMKKGKTASEKFLMKKR
ncbi:DUF6265 family protein [Flavobacterium sp. DG2-3]|uniref:DUF6265 family protein n=1 Tax=Flavobacterium sp. DG2-3 TaxID=3068317 RepID=UPI00273D6FCE|nr:DUF6265 family protein [Flavobacterium sp. DG2-3]MDP5200086.1 DUF6265 family protein [Flavobacterium sp. DG2-3]